MPDLGGREGGPGRLRVDELADEDDVGILAEAAAQRGRVPQRVGAHLPLGHDGLGVGVEHLDRVLDGEDVTGALVVDPVDERGHRARLAGPRRTGHEDQPLLLLGEARDLQREAQVVELGDLRRDAPHRHRERAALAVDRDPEATETRDAQPGAGLTRGGEIFLAGAVEHAGSQCLDDAGGRDLERGRTQLPIDAHVGNRAGLQMQVRTLDLVQIRQELFQLGHLAYIGRRCPELQPKSASSALTRAAAAMASRPGPPLVTGSGTRRSPSRAATHAADDEASASRS